MDDAKADVAVTSRWPRLAKQPDRLAVAPNLADYDATRASFSWTAARASLAGLPGGRGLNIAHETVDRHAEGPLASKLAIRWIGRGGERLDISYRTLRAETN